MTTTPTIKQITTTPNMYATSYLVDFKINQNFTSDLNNKSSSAYLNLTNKIINFVNNYFFTVFVKYFNYKVFFNLDKKWL